MMRTGKSREVSDFGDSTCTSDKLFKVGNIAEITRVRKV